jgi:hypothetical protein
MLFYSRGFLGAGGQCLQFNFMLLAVAAIAIIVQPTFTTPTSATIPLNSWDYSTLDKFGGLGLIRSSLRASRPSSRLEVDRQSVEANEGEWSIV